MIHFRSSKPDIHTLALAGLIDAGDGTKTPEVERHLRECDSCAAEGAQLTRATATLTATASAVPSPGLRDRVAEAARQSPRTSSARRDEPLLPALWQKFRRGGFAVATAAALLLVVFLGGSVLNYSDEPDSNPAQKSLSVAAILGAQDAVTRSVSTPGGGTLTVTTSPRNAASVATTSNMSPLPAERTYQLWLLGPNYAHSAGLAGADGTTRLVPHARDATSIGITVEPKAGSDRPTNKPVLVTTLQ